MWIGIVAVGHLGLMPETALAKDWCKRGTAQGRQLGIGPVEVIEVEGKKPGKVAEGRALLEAAGPDVCLIACHERGDALKSRDFAQRLARLRDQGERRVAFLIGGADGLADEVLNSVRMRIAFGPQTWPHALVRAMLAEQVYRATTILAGTPYHRD
jgi:23S rRNA (pseudouridine1915-N3)-methyltransferase